MSKEPTQRPDDRDRGVGGVVADFLDSHRTSVFHHASHAKIDARSTAFGGSFGSDYVNSGDGRKKNKQRTSDSEGSNSLKSGRSDTGPKRVKSVKSKKSISKREKSPKGGEESTRKSAGSANDAGNDSARNSERKPSKAQRKRIMIPQRTAMDDAAFLWLLDQESAKHKITSYDPKDIHVQLPEHIWLLTPSIKWDFFREEKERQRLRKLELEEEEAIRRAEEQERKKEEKELVSLYKRPESCHHHPNPCPCKDGKRKGTPSPRRACREEPKVKSAEDKCWDDYQERQRHAAKMRWFASVLVSAHKRRPNWIPPPKECLRVIRHKLLQEQAHLEKAEKVGKEADAAEDIVRNEPSPPEPKAKLTQSLNDGIKKRKPSEKVKGGSASVLLQKPSRKKT